MRIFLAGGTGVIGRRLVPQLVQAGHQVTVMTRHTDQVQALHSRAPRWPWPTSMTPPNWARS